MRLSWFAAYHTSPGETLSRRAVRSPASEHVVDELLAFAALSTVAALLFFGRGLFHSFAPSLLLLEMAAPACLAVLAVFALVVLAAAVAIIAAAFPLLDETTHSGSHGAL